MRSLSTTLTLVAITLAGCSSTPPGTGGDGGTPLTCGAGSDPCAGQCVVLQSDHENCGACGTACAVGQACVKGACYALDCSGTDCSAAQVCPADKCVDRLCVGVSCPADQQCVSGACLAAACESRPCSAGLVCINNQCEDTSCFGVLCPAGGVCELGACRSSRCDDGVLGGSETDVDCGGSCPTKCPLGQGCTTGADCATTACTSGSCTLVATCSNGSKDGTETDVDCGGSCRPCADGRACAVAADCGSQECTAGRCTSSAQCGDGLKNNTETDVDCGGSCPAKCAVGGHCGVAADCVSGACATGTCAQVSTCTNAAKDGLETDVDCGGSACSVRCADGASCVLGSDCASGRCNASLKCAAASCTDTVKNGTETGVDCGGAVCASRCPGGQGCATGADCVDKVCATNLCQAPTCTDAVQNGTESDADCGGLCPTCGGGKRCRTSSDCTVGACTLGICDADPSCTDMVKNQDEVDVDCGGTHCAACAVGKRCVVPTDCVDLFCTGMVCSVGYPNHTFTADPGGTGTRRTMAGRLNADLFPDVVVLQTAGVGYSLAVYLGTGSATLGAPVRIPICGTVTSAALADFNNDSRLDIIYICQSMPTTANVLLGNGDGTFAAALTTNVVNGINQAGALAVGDVNGDGKLDIATAFPVGGTPKTVVALGTGLGNFLPSVEFISGPAGTSVNGDVFLLDITGDGKPDLLSGLANNTVSVMVNNTAAMAATPSFTLNSTTFPVGGAAVNIRAGDFNKDGKSDVVVSTASGLLVFLSTGASFFPALTFGGLGSPDFVVPVDLNGDGNLDIAFGGSNLVGLLLGNGAGSFRRGRSASGGTSMAGLAVNDFNIDGRPDLATGGDNAGAGAYIFLNQ